MEFQEKGSGAKKHFLVSLVKSVIRIGGCGFLFCGEYMYAGIILGLAELVGVYEEIV